MQDRGDGRVVRSSSARELGGTRPYSPPVVLVGDLLEHEARDTATFGSRHFRPHFGEAEPVEGSPEIEVIFDPGIGCYYDPKTNKYYTCIE